MIWAWLGAAAVGLSLGLLGSGGTILTVPILVYLVGHNEKTAIAESLAIVGVIAFAGSIQAARQKRVDVRSAVLLGVPGIAGTFLGAAAAVFVSGALQLLILAVLMLTASAMMFNDSRMQVGRSSPGTPDAKPPPSRGLVWGIVAQGIGLGFATGLVGVGGGFLIIPVLVLLRRLPMRTAIGTSLAIITINSATGFLNYLAVFAGQDGATGQTARIDWSIIGIFTAIGVAGSFVGGLLSEHIPQVRLRRAFAVFLIFMAGYIVVRQVPRLWPAQPAPARSSDSIAPPRLGTPPPLPASQNARTMSSDRPLTTADGPSAAGTTP